jgi:hypothetical protein
VPRVPLLLLLALAVARPATAQRPDFTGVWTLGSAADNQPSVATRGDASFRVGQMGSGWGSKLTIAQDATRMTVEYVFFGSYDLQPPLKYVFALDGSESINAIMIGHATSEQRSRAAWRGDTLVITTRYPAPGMGGRPQTAEVRQALVLESPDNLLIRTTRTDMAGAQAVAETTRYRKG